MNLWKLLFLELAYSANNELKMESICIIQVQNLNCELLVDNNKSVLDNLLHHNIPIRHKCHLGICGSCKYKLKNGKVRNNPDFCLSEKEIAENIYLACCSFPDEDFEIEII